MSGEARIEVGGVLLSSAQAASVRVAVGNMLMELHSPSFREALGPIADAYRARLGEVQDLIFESLEATGGGTKAPA